MPSAYCLKYHTKYIFKSSRIRFLIIYGFKVCVFFIKEVVILSKIFAPLRENEHSDLQYEHPGFFDTEVNRTIKRSTNICNIH